MFLHQTWLLIFVSHLLEKAESVSIEQICALPLVAEIVVAQRLVDTGHRPTPPATENLSEKQGGVAGIRDTQYLKTSGVIFRSSSGVGEPVLQGWVGT